MHSEPRGRTDSEPSAPPPYPFRGVLRFVALFVALVLLQLIAYRYFVNSLANDWYLFQVARHTTWLLDHVGHGATLESTGPLRRPGAVPPTDDPGTALTAPASPWEQWQHRAQAARTSSTPPPELGPLVTFVLRPGTHHTLYALEAARAENPAFTAAQDAEIQALRDEITAALADPEKRAAQQGKQFRFHVVPTCGATEIMAIFLAAVLAFPATWRQRLAGLTVGIPALYGINIIRLACLATIGTLDSGGDWFNFFHEYVWQALYVIVVVLLWLAWVEFLIGRRNS